MVVGGEAPAGVTDVAGTVFVAVIDVVGNAVAAGEIVVVEVFDVRGGGADMVV